MKTNRTNRTNPIATTGYRMTRWQFADWCAVQGIFAGHIQIKLTDGTRTTYEYRQLNDGWLIRDYDATKAKILRIFDSGAGRSPEWADGHVVTDRVMVNQ